MFCPKCSIELPDDADFCIKCRADLRPAKRLTPTGEKAPAERPTPSGTVGDLTTMVGASPLAILGPGTRIADRYEVRELLGQGGMGSVYRVHDRVLRQDCALKLMHAHLLSNERAVERFIREARISLELQHPNIIRIRDIGEWDQLRYLTMELLEGRSLRSWLTELERQDRQVPLETVTSIINQTLSALAFAHARTVHRDVKPENIFLVGSEPEFQVKLLDFGIAKAMDREALTSTSMSLGTAWYMAPEQRKEAATVDARADLYAVGVVLYELLTGSLPTGRVLPPSKKRAGVSTDWDELVLDAMEEAPDDRPSTARVMRDRMEGLRSGDSPTVSEERTPLPAEQPELPGEIPDETPDQSEERSSLVPQRETVQEAVSPRVSPASEDIVTEDVATTWQRRLRVVKVVGIGVLGVSTAAFVLLLKPYGDEETASFAWIGQFTGAGILAVAASLKAVVKESTSRWLTVVKTLALVLLATALLCFEVLVAAALGWLHAKWDLVLPLSLACGAATALPAVAVALLTRNRMVKSTRDTGPRV